ncbi:MAG: MepB family protein, partial [Chitinophagaceae bacterium]
ILADKGIISQNGRSSGKRGIRVYPPWDIVSNKQAIMTQGWQTKYFMTIQTNETTDLNLIKTLFT